MYFFFVSVLRLITPDTQRMYDFVLRKVWVTELLIEHSMLQNISGCLYGLFQITQYIFKVTRIHCKFLIVS